MGYQKIVVPADGGEKKKSGTKRIWQMDESEKPRRKTNGTTRPNTKAPRGRSRNGR